MDFSKIKLIVWDLDETFWRGTLSEEGVEPIADNAKLVIDLSKRGIVNSICSKNDHAPAMDKVAELGLADYFVFCSIDWNPKGERVKSIVDNMALRYENVLFVDDNISNLKEAEFYCPGIMTALPIVLEDLRDRVGSLGKDDGALERLTQYRQLEDKHVQKTSFSTNEEFLVDSGIRVEISYDTGSQEDRLHELVMRTNQLNFTKRRETPEDFHALLRSSDCTSGYVKVVDRYGDYGIVGFFAVRDDKLLHFVFSCRTMGMGIEQYVYAELGFPEIEIIGPVSGDLVRGERPTWVNRVADAPSDGAPGERIKARVLVKGPCDLEAIVKLIKVDGTDTELVHVNDCGRQVEIHCATQNIVNALTLSHEERERLREVMPFYEDAVFETKIFDGGYDVIVLSLLADFNFGVYESRLTGTRVALGQDFRDITDPAHWQDYIDGRVFNGAYRLDKAQLRRFADLFVKVEYDVEDIIANVAFIRSRIKPGSRLVMLLGAERAVERYEIGNYAGRAARHRRANEALKRRFAADDRVTFIEPSKYIAGDDDYLDHINHYSKRVMFNLASEVSNVLSGLGVNARTRSPLEVVANKVADRVRGHIPWLRRAG